MAWLRIDDRVRTHPKIVSAGPAAAWFWFCGIGYCREHLTDGFIPAGMLASLAPGVTNGRTLAQRLVDAQLWYAVMGGYQVHDFLDWNPSKAEVLEGRMSERDRKRTERSCPDGQTPESSRVRAGAPARARDLGIGSERSSSEESARETNAPDGLGAWFWQEWRRLMAETSQIILPIEPKRAESEQIVRAVDMVPDASRLTSALERFMRLSADQAKAMNVKAKSVGYFVMALPMLLANPLQEFSAKELADASEIRRKAFGRCPHEPGCATFEMCVRLIAEERRQKASA